jgi:RimJ/RimL family protein N-acetyltransferase
VELDHPIVFGRFASDLLVAAASHFRFEDFGVAAPGVFTHPEYRRLGYGTAVVSAAVSWALERSFLVEWSTSESNIGSLAVAEKLGFRPYAVETEFRIGESRSPAA